MKSLSLTFKKSDANNLFHKPLNSEVRVMNVSDYNIGGGSVSQIGFVKGTIVYSQEFKCGKVVLVRVERQDTFLKDEEIVPLWLSQCGPSGTLIQKPYHGQDVDPDLIIAFDTYKLQTQKSELDEREFLSLHPLMTA